VAALAAACLIAAAVPRSQAAGAGDDAQAGVDWCATIPPGTGHPPINLTPVTVQVLQRAVEPVPATDGLIHLVYAAQVTNTQTPPDDGPEVESPLAFVTHVPAGNSGLMFFDVTYTDPARIPRLLAHAITLAGADGGPDTPALTNPVPVGCRPLSVLRPPLVGHGWVAIGGCCSFAAYHRDSVPPVNGVLQAGLQFAIDYVQIGPNGSFCAGQPQALSSWWSYGSSILAAAPGVVVAVMDGLPDQEPVGTVTNLTAANSNGNSVIVDIGSGRYIDYAHMKPGTIPAWVRNGAVLRRGDLIGRVGNSGNSSAPHLHFQAMDSPSAAGLHRVAIRVRLPAARGPRPRGRGGAMRPPAHRPNGSGLAARLDAVAESGVRLQSAPVAAPAILPSTREYSICRGALV
jgi:hypothetical protein